MFDRDLIDELSPEERINVKLALATLAGTNLFQLQQQLILARLSHGSETESKEELADRVLKYRADKSRLLNLQQLGESFIEERNDDQQ